MIQSMYFHKKIIKIRINFSKYYKHVCLISDLYNLNWRFGAVVVITKRFHLTNPKLMFYTQVQIVLIAFLRFVMVRQSLTVASAGIKLNVFRLSTIPQL